LYNGDKGRAVVPWSESIVSGIREQNVVVISKLKILKDFLLCREGGRGTDRAPKDILRISLSKSPDCLRWIFIVGDTDFDLGSWRSLSGWSCSGGSGWRLRLCFLGIERNWVFGYSKRHLHFVDETASAFGQQNIWRVRCWALLVNSNPIARSIDRQVVR